MMSKTYERTGASTGSAAATTVRRAALWWQLLSSAEAVGGPGICWVAADGGHSPL